MWAGLAESRSVGVGGRGRRARARPNANYCTAPNGRFPCAPPPHPYTGQPRSAPPPSPRAPLTAPATPLRRARDAFNLPRTPHAIPTYILTARRFPLEKYKQRDRKHSPGPTPSTPPSPTTPLTRIFLYDYTPSIVTCNAYALL